MFGLVWSRKIMASSFREIIQRLPHRTNILLTKMEGFLLKMLKHSTVNEYWDQQWWYYYVQTTELPNMEVANTVYLLYSLVEEGSQCNSICIYRLLVNFRNQKCFFLTRALY